LKVFLLAIVIIAVPGLRIIYIIVDLHNLLNFITCIGRSNQATPREDVLEKLYKHTKLSATRTNGSHPHFNFIDLFAGIGGMRMGFEKIGGKCVFTSEWNKYARQTYLANFACDHPIEGDITKINESDIPKHDVLLAGFPCQPFSIAGVSKKNSLGKAHGFKDRTQGTLFFDIARIIAHHQPIAFVLENVRNLTFHDKGNTFNVIKETLEKELGYTISYKIINAKSFVPQHREKVFIVGFKNSIGFSLRVYASRPFFFFINRQAE
jgi:DNA (cytosine-5)-methyltransferase 1